MYCCVLSYLYRKVNLHCYSNCRLMTLHCVKASFHHSLCSSHASYLSKPRLCLFSKKDLEVSYALYTFNDLYKVNHLKYDFQLGYHIFQSHFYDRM